MPKLRIDQHGGYTIRNGYFVESGTEQIVRSLRVLPRAAQVFSLAEHHDAQEVPKELFYALLVERDITNDRFDARPATVCNIPQAVLTSARRYENHAIHSEVRRYLRELNLRHAPFVIDHFSAILHLRTYRRAHALKLASYFSIVRHVKQYFYDRQQARQRTFNYPSPARARIRPPATAHGKRKPRSRTSRKA